MVCVLLGARGGAVTRATALQARRSRVRFPVVSSELIIDIILFRPHHGPGVDRNEYQEYFLEVKEAGE